MTAELFTGGALRILGELGYALELLLGVIGVVLGSIGVFRCVQCEMRGFDPPLVEPKCSVMHEAPPSGKDIRSGQAGEVTIRLEPGFSRFLRKRRCVVTIRGTLDDACKADREEWYTGAHD